MILLAQENVASNANKYCTVLNIQLQPEWHSVAHGSQGQTVVNNCFLYQEVKFF